MLISFKICFINYYIRYTLMFNLLCYLGFKFKFITNKNVSVIILHLMITALVLYFF